MTEADTTNTKARLQEHRRQHQEQLKAIAEANRAVQRGEASPTLLLELKKKYLKQAEQRLVEALKEVRKQLQELGG